MNFQNVKLSLITADPHQPRRIFHKNEMEELKESITEVGLLQPIIVRTDGKKFVIVSGERRFRALKELGFKETTASIVEADEKATTEMQITENLQRASVTPLEEAIAISKLFEMKATLKEVAKKLGKAESYIARRKKLSDLIDDFKELMFNGKLDIDTAIRVAQLAPTNQKELYKSLDIDTPDEDDDDDNESVTDQKVIHISRWHFNKFKQNLSDAIFDLKDKKLAPQMGACTTCQFNTASTHALLFPEEDKEASCTHPSCFELKVETTIIARFKTQMDLNSDEIWVTGDDELFEMVKKNFPNAVYKKRYHDIEIIDPPAATMPFDEWKEEQWNVDEKTAAALKKEYKDYLKEQEVDIEEYNLELKNSTPCFNLDSGNVVSAKNYTRSSYSSSSQVTKIKKVDVTLAKLTKGEITTNDIDGEIERLSQRERRSRELDEQKYTSDIKAMLKEKYRAYFTNSSPLTEPEKAALALAVKDALGYGLSAVYTESYAPDNHKAEPCEIVKDLTTKLQDPEECNRLLRLFLFSHFTNIIEGTSSSKSPSAIALLYTSCLFFENDVKGIDTIRNKKASERIDRFDKQVDKLTKIKNSKA